LVFQRHGAALDRNVGLELAQGNYVCFVDLDNVIEENIFGELKNAQKKPAVNAWCFHSMNSTSVSQGKNYSKKQIYLWT